MKSGRMILGYVAILVTLSSLAACSAGRGAVRMADEVGRGAVSVADEVGRGAASVADDAGRGAVSIADDVGRQADDVAGLAQLVNTEGNSFMNQIDQQSTIRLTDQEEKYMVQAAKRCGLFIP